MDEREAFLKTYDKFFQQMGQGKTSGTILGVLMIAEKDGMTLDELSEAVGRAKSTVHSSIKNLEELGIVEVEVDDSEPSEGRYPHFYSFRKDFFEFALKKTDAIPAFKKLISDAIKFLKRDGISDGRVEAFEKTYAMYTWWEEKLQDNLKEWEALLDSGDYRRYLETIQ